MGASARDAHVISPRSNVTRSGFDCRRAPVGATLYSPGVARLVYMSAHRTVFAGAPLIRGFRMSGIARPNN
jgi:hypothetical protein